MLKCLIASSEDGTGIVSQLEGIIHYTASIIDLCIVRVQNSTSIITDFEKKDDRQSRYFSNGQYNSKIRN